MANRDRFVFDTNTIVSALLVKHSSPRKAFDKAMELGVIIVSLAVVQELYDVLGRDKFNKYVSEEERVQFLIALLHDAVAVEISETVIACRDPKDDKFLDLAVNGEANCIISGDADLLSLHPFRNIAILSPQDFLDSVQDQ